MVSVLNIQQPVFADSGTAGKVSFGFFSQYHSFAVLPALEDSESSSRSIMAVAVAGDWTKECNAKASTDLTKPNTETMYVRRFATPGFMYLARTYKRVLCVATGAGIAPVSAYLPNNRDMEMMILWIGRNFEETYGPLLDVVKNHSHSVLIDTTKPHSAQNPYTPQGCEVPVIKGKERPNIAKLSLAAAKIFEADAVFVVSGPQPTYDVCYELWANNIHCYGATWDS